VKEYIMELNRIYNEDCLEGMKYIDDKSIDMILCDLPYGTTACKWDIIIPFDKLWEQYNRIIKDNGAIVLFGSEPFSSKLRMSNLKMYKYDWVWEKEQGTNQLLSKKQPLRKTENITIFYRKQSIYNPQMENGKPYKIERKLGGEIYGKEKIIQTTNEGLRFPTNILKFNRELRERYHPTQKPVALFEYLIKTYTNEGELVLDNCIGSGTTAIACINTNRNYIGFELNKEYYEIAKNRINKHIIDNNLQGKYSLIT